MDVEIEVPSHFLCPISMQLMKDPVTISTGITYDRESIERWLFTCRSTSCPVTKQTLFDTDLTPNHTLRRLIQSWCTVNSIHVLDPVSTPKKPLDMCLIIKLIDEAKIHPHNKIKCLRKIRSIVLASDRGETCMEGSDLFEFLAKVILKENNQCFFVTEACDEALIVLHHFQCTDLQVMDPTQIAGLKSDIFDEIIRILKCNVSQQTIKASLEVVVEIIRWGRNRIKAAESGMVSVLVELLIDNSDRRVCELMLVTLEQICRCAEGREKLVEHAAGLATVSKKILRVSHIASDRAVRILCLVCRFSACLRVLQEMVEVGVVSKLCLMIQVESGERTKDRVKQILTLHSKVWKDASCIPAHLLSSYPSL
nr:E3 ubiquitin-protein ligase PUB23-like [Tanacetum cinerariifolium]